MLQVQRKRWAEIHIYGRNPLNIYLLAGPCATTLQLHVINFCFLAKHRLICLEGLGHQNFIFLSPVFLPPSQLERKAWPCCLKLSPIKMPFPTNSVRLLSSCWIFLLSTHIWYQLSWISILIWASRLDFGGCVCHPSIRSPSFVSRTQ